DVGIKYYNKGDTVNLVRSWNFFVDYLEDNPGDKAAKKWIDKIEVEYIEKGKKDIDNHFENQEFQKALDIAEDLISISPNDDEIKEAHKELEKINNDQIEINDFTNYLEHTHRRMLEVYNFWDNS